MLFHYDGRTTEWDEFEWSKRAIHVSVKRQTKWLDNMMFMLEFYFLSLITFILPSWNSLSAFLF